MKPEGAMCITIEHRQKTYQHVMMPDVLKPGNVCRVLPVTYLGRRCLNDQ